MKSNKLELLTIKIGSGITPRGGASVYQNSGVHLIRSQNIYNDRFEMKGIVCISNEIATKMKSVEVMKDDVLINITGDSVTRTYLVPDEILPARVNQHVCILRTKPELNPHYLYYFLINPVTQNHLLNISGIGGTRNALTKDMLSNLIVKYPDYQIQEKIITQLNAIKNKIIILEKENKILEQIAQAIFKSWFVDFDGITEFEDSELGKIPKRWKVGNLGDICEIIMGSSPSGQSYNEEGDGIIFFQGKTDFGDFFPTPRIYCSMPKRFAEKNDVLFTVRAPVGSINIAKEKYCIGRGLASLRLKENHGCFLYFFLKYLDGKWNKFEADGTVFGSINKDDLSEFKLSISPTELRTKFNNIIKPIYNLIWKNNVNLQVLTQTRDALLPKLMSGEIRV